MTLSDKHFVLLAALAEEQKDIGDRLFAIDAGLGKGYAVAAATFLASPMTEFDKYFALSVALINEQTDLLARLSEIDSVFGVDYKVGAAPSPATKITPGKPSFNAVLKAKIAAAEKARGAAKNGVTAGKAVADGTPKQLKGTMSAAAAHARIQALIRARRTKVKKVASSASPKHKRKLSAARLAIMIAEAKARWAKVIALTVESTQ